jgi:hypothetical protein
MIREEKTENAIQERKTEEEVSTARSNTRVN